MNEVKKDEPVDRTCATCACMQLIENPQNKLQKQAFCRLSPPKHGQVRTETPRLSRTGEIVNDRHGKPIMEPVVQSVFVYDPTDARLTCFNGWRPIGTLPGDKWDTQIAMKPFMDAFARLQNDMIRDVLRTDPVDGDLQ